MFITIAILNIQAPRDAGENIVEPYSSNWVEYGATLYVAIRNGGFRLGL